MKILSCYKCQKAKESVKWIPGAYVEIYPDSTRKYSYYMHTCCESCLPPKDEDGVYLFYVLRTNLPGWVVGGYHYALESIAEQLINEKRSSVSRTRDLSGVMSS